MKEHFTYADMLLAYEFGKNDGELYLFIKLLEEMK